MSDLSEGRFIHPSAIVSSDATLERGVKVWHFCHVRERVVLARDSQLGQGCYVAPGVHIGVGCRIQNNVSIYEGVELAEDVFVGPSAVFTNVLTPRAHTPRRGEFATTIVEQGVSIGANATIVCGVRLGHDCMIGAGSVVTRDVPPFALVAGNPARPLGWVCRCGEKLDVSSALASCSRCERRYHLADDVLSLLPSPQEP